MFVTPRVGDGESGHDWALPAAAADTVVLYMAGRQAEAISAGLVAAGVPAGAPGRVRGERVACRTAASCRRGSARWRRAADALGDGPALLLIGDVYEHIVAAAERRELPLQLTA